MSEMIVLYQQSRRLISFARAGSVGLFAVLLALSAGAQGYERIHSPSENDPMDVAIYTLDNGLTVYLTENHETPRFYAEIGVRAGSVQDPPESTGLAHYLEHMLFKGTDMLGTLDYESERPYLEEIEALYEEHFHETDPEKRAELFRQINEASRKAAEFAVPNELDRIYASMGGNMVNAHTWHEETIYKVNLPANRLQQWAQLEAERFRNPVFRLFQTELETVYEEMNRALDSKQRIISEAVNELLYKKHPYGQQPTLGLPEQLKNPSLRNIGIYYDTYYVPNNMAIFISGAIDTEETITLIAKHFGSYESQEIPERKTWKEEPLDGREYVETTYEAEPYVMLAFRTVPHSHEDAEALQLLDMILDNATAGLINLNLNQSQKVRESGSYPAQYNDYGAQYLWGVPKEDQTHEEVEALLLEQVELVKNGAFEDWILPAIINDFKKTEKKGLESDTSRVAAMRRSWIGFEDWEHTVTRIDRMEDITRDDIIRVANTYFGEDYVAGYRKVAPHEVLEIEKPELATFNIDPSRESIFAAALMAQPHDPLEPEFIDPESDYQVKDFSQGWKLYHAPNPINDIFNFTISVDFGQHEDPLIGAAIQLLEKSGAGDLSAEDLQKEWYKLGTDFSVNAGDNETTISLSGLDENFEASLALLMKVLTEPTADEGTLEELKGIMLARREDMKRQADGIAAALVQYNRLGEDSAYLRMLPSDELKALTVEQLQEAIKQLAQYEHAVFYTGALPLRKVQRALKKHRPIREALQETPAYNPLRVREAEEREIYFVPKETNQATVRIEFGGPQYNPELAPAVQYFNEYFAGGMAGLVFQELREARALAYIAAARYIQGNRSDDENLMVGFIQTQNDKTPEALAAFIELIDAMPMSQERFHTAREAIINNYRTGKVDFRSILGTVRTWERRGLKPDPRKAWYEKVQTAESDLIAQFHEEFVSQKPKLISIVGDPERIDMEALKAIAPIREIGLEEIFVP